MSTNDGVSKLEMLSLVTKKVAKLNVLDKAEERQKISVGLADRNSSHIAMSPEPYFPSCVPLQTNLFNLN